VPRNRSLFFVGRERELSTLQEALTRDTRLTVQVALEGLAGVGKTELALQLVHRLASEGCFPGGIFWLEAETPDLRSAWGVALSEHEERSEGSIGQRCAAQVRRIEKAGALALVVLDNVSAWHAGARPGPLPSGAHVRVLVTTRMRNLGGAQFHHLNLDMLEPPHDHELLLSLAGRDPGPGTRELLEHIDGHALALELAGAFLRTYPGDTAATYLEALREGGAAVERTVVDRTRYAGTAEQAFRTVWDRLPPSTRKAWRLASVFQPEPASRSLSAAAGLDAQALRELEAHHLIRSTASGSWVMHRLTRDFAQSRCRARERKTAQLAFVRGSHALLAISAGSETHTLLAYVADRSHFDRALELGHGVWGDEAPALAELRTQIAIGRDLLGDLAGSRELLEQVVGFCRRALACCHPRGSGLSRVDLQIRLGLALRRLGQREAGIERLEQAADAFQAALSACSREESPLEWAACQHHLGDTFRVLGRPLTHVSLGHAVHERPEREEGAGWLELAVAAYRAALEERTRERTPFDWATSLHDLGNALGMLGWRQSSSMRLHEAMSAFRAALEERTRERMPREWALTQSNLGSVMFSLGKLVADERWLEDALDCFRCALEELTRDRSPMDWAATQQQLASALRSLGMREAGPARLHEAVACYRQVLEEVTRDSLPLQWAASQKGLGLSLAALAQRESDHGLVSQASEALLGARQVWESSGFSGLAKQLDTPLASLEHADGGLGRER
jgi:tetratricopeptide (TPR) repeat protein